KTQHLERLGIEGLAFERAGDNRSCEELADSSWLGVIEVAAAAPGLLDKRQQPVYLGLIRLPVLLPSEETGLVCPSQNHQRADLEGAGQPVKVLRQFASTFKLTSEFVHGHEQFGGDGVAPPLDVLRRTVA